MNLMVCGTAAEECAACGGWLRLHRSIFLHALYHLPRDRTTHFRPAWNIWIFPRHQYPIMSPTLAEQELYDRLNDYRTQLKADSLTPFDIQQFMKTCHIQDIEPRKIYRHIAMGNACSWGSYLTACVRYEKYKSGLKK